MTTTKKSALPLISLAEATDLVKLAARTDVQMAEILTKLATSNVWSYYKTLRTAFIDAYCEASGASKDAAAKRWERLCKAAGYKAPASTSKAAVAKREARAKAAKPDEADKTTEGRIVKPGTAQKAAKTVKVELIAIEAHIVDLWRRGQFKALIDICHSEAEKAAPM